MESCISAKSITKAPDYSPAPRFQARAYYTGIVNEGQARWRKPIKGNYHTDLVFGLGWDFWTRELSYFQKEDYNIVYLRLGGELAVNSNKGWVVGAGIKYPVYTHENAHLTDIGFDSNPTLKPGPELSGYAQIGYWFNDKLGLIGYFESYRFKKSNEEMVNSIFGPPARGVPAGKHHVDFRAEAGIQDQVATTLTPNLSPESGVRQDQNKAHSGVPFSSPDSG